MFIVFEGADGSGKTTQLRAVADVLRDGGVPVTTTREPGGSPTFGPVLRDLLLHTGKDRGDRTEALLFAADRAEHVRTVVGPALERGEVVLCDRFVDSTLAYQGAGRGLDEGDLLSLCAFATGGLMPDLVVVIDVDPLEARRRQQDRGAADLMESAVSGDLVRPLLLRRAAADPGRYVVVDGVGTPEQVTGRVLAALTPHLSQLTA